MRLITSEVQAAGLEGELSVPAAATGAVIFAHGSGSSRHSPRNRYVAGVLNEAGLATLLIDLSNADLPNADLFDADRLVAVTRWLSDRPQLEGLKIGYFGASTGAAVALLATVKLAAIESPVAIHAVVSRGGRPDLAGDALERVEAPTLAIVGGNDPVVLELNRQALARMHCPKQLHVIPGAGHLFEEPGALEEVATLARAWLLRSLGP
jgi:putative phosphoribosyl transferase